MNELMVSRARWSLIPLLRPTTTENDSEGTSSKTASPDISLPRHDSAPSSSTSDSSGGFRTRMKYMRDKIRRRVVQTGDWPPPGAIFGDRYSVSSGIGAMLAAGRQIPTPGAMAGGNWSAPPSRKMYSSQKRNIETFPLKKSGGSDAEGKKSPASKKGGIVCSEMDMNAIIAGFREFEKSIRILHHNSGVCAVVEDGKSAGSSDRTETNTEDPSLPTIQIESVDAVSTEKETVSDTKIGKTDPSPTSSLRNTQSSKKQVSFDDRTVSEKSQIKVDSRQAYPKHESDVIAESASIDEQLAEISEPMRKEIQVPKEIEFDEFGQTWEVYGADFDPEILGLAIQRRLDNMMGTDESETDLGEEEQKCERIRRLWRNLLCLTRRHNRQSFNRSSSGASKVK